MTRYNEADAGSSALAVICQVIKDSRFVMGLIGWADAPNSVESENTDSSVPIAPASEEPRLSIDGRYDLFENNVSFDTDECVIEELDDRQRAQDNEIFFSKFEEYDIPDDDFDRVRAASREAWIEEYETENNSNFDPDQSDIDRCKQIESENAMPVTDFDQVVDAIRALKLRDADGSGETCDISQIELHEIEFVIRHAERVGDVDFFKLAREVHAVKHRILEMTDTPDYVNSSNLDSLMKLVEEKYEESYSENAQ